MYYSSFSLYTDAIPMTERQIKRPGATHPTNDITYYDVTI